jgi:dethiobiotin synthetase
MTRERDPIIVAVGATGRDTGKTTTTCAIARSLVAAGRSVLAIKAIEPWCDGGFVDVEDGVRLARATGQTEPKAALVRVRGQMPLPLAVEAFGNVDWGALIQRLRTYARTVEVTLVEGVANLLTPLTFEKNLLDLARELGAPVLLVSGDHSHETQHSLAARLACEKYRVPLIGQVINVARKPDHYTGFTQLILERLTGERRLVTVPPVRDDLEASARPEYATICDWVMAAGTATS